MVGSLTLEYEWCAESGSSSDDDGFSSSEDGKDVDPAAEFDRDALLSDIRPAQPTILRLSRCSARP